MNEFLIDFPVITIADGWCIRYLQSLEDLIIVPKSVVKNNIYNGLVIIDGSNKYFEIGNITVNKYLGIFKLKCRIEVEFSKQSSYSWGILQEHLTSAINKDVNFWQNIGLYSTIISRVEQCKSSKELIGSFIEMVTRRCRSPNYPIVNSPLIA